MLRLEDTLGIHCQPPNGELQLLEFLEELAKAYFRRERRRDFMRYLEDALEVLSRQPIGEPFPGEHLVACLHLGDGGLRRVAGGRQEPDETLEQGLPCGEDR